MVHTEELLVAGINTNNGPSKSETRFIKKYLVNKVEHCVHISLQAAVSKTCWQAAFTRRNYKDRMIRKTCEKGGREKGNCENYLIFELREKKVQNILTKTSADILNPIKRK